MKYKVGDKVVMEIISADQDEIKKYSVSGVNNNWRWCLPQNLLERYTEPLSTYTEPLESKIQKQSAEILKQKEIIDKLLNENEKLMFKIDAYELYGDQHEEEYKQAFNQGAEAAWELARKITCQPINGGFKRSEFEEIFNEGYISDIFEKYTYPEAAAKVAQWEKEKEEIKVGDVYMSRVGNYFVIYDIDHEKGIAKILWSDLSNSARELDDIKEYYIKTGRHIDIDGFLKQIGGEE